MLTYVILDVHSQLDFIQDTRKSSKTPWRKLSRHIEESLPPVHQVEWNIAHKLLVYTYIKWPRSHSGINNSIQDILDDVLEMHRRITSSSGSRGLKILAQFP